MKLMPPAIARSSTACAVASSEPTLCMNDFSSASPNVIAPRHRLDTLTPAPPRLRYFMRRTLPDYAKGVPMSATAVETAQAKGWRHVYFNALTIAFWGVHLLAIVGVALLGFSWLGIVL